MAICNAISGISNNKCNQPIKSIENNFCKIHQYFNDFTNEQVEIIRAGNGKTCCHCNRFHFDVDKSCNKCKLKQNTNAKAKRAQNVKCLAISTTSFKKCINKAQNNNRFCITHEYFNEYTDEQLQQILNGYKIICSGCCRFKFSDNKWCDKCTNDYKKKKIEEKQRIIQCAARLENGELCSYEASNGKYCSTHYDYEMIDPNIAIYCSGCHTRFISNNKHKVCDKCLGIKPIDNIDVNTNTNKCIGLIRIVGKKINIKCNNLTINNNSKFCKVHINHFNKFTNDELNNLVYCVKCREYNLMVDGNMKCCINKPNPPVTNINNIFTNNIKNNINKNCLCDKPKQCTYKASNISTYKDYCRFHQSYARKKIEYDDKGVKVCSDWIRGCWNEVTTKKKCENCLAKERIKDKKRFDKKCMESTKIVNDTNGNKLRKCIECNDLKDPNTFVTSRGDPSNKCGDCLEYFKEYDANRNRDPIVERERYKKYDNSEDGKYRKEKFKVNNPGKSAEYTQIRRKKLVETLGKDMFLKICAANSMNYRELNPEKQLELYRRMKMDIKNKLKKFKYSLNDRHKYCNLRDEDILLLFTQPCAYCHHKYTDGDTLNGIDRADNEIDYIYSNCISCCWMCNKMKGELFDSSEFLLYAKHIMTLHGFIISDYKYDIVRNYISGTYNKYKNSAIKRNKQFLLTIEEFNSIKSGNCYICDKANTAYNLNGIDRVNSNIGYIFENCKACCGACNYIKNNYNIYDMMKKLYNICMVRSLHP